ncbi:hypothetical protein ACRFNZ_28255 [Klebsiella quasipneumoniae]|uniref:hypothetical protein n=1 Tax=Klebsiella quasipneumoniae TaxID=1463165 RepID=UPI00280B6264|nr:hypothetical protein [Klebsiella quasipneumoniae]
MNIETVNELIKSLESAGELSIREQKFLKLAKEFRICSASLDAAIKTGNMLADQNAQLATENMALKAAVAEEIEVINRGGQRYCVKDGMSINPIYARGWNDHRANLAAEKTPATDRIVAGIKADGVDIIRNALIKFVEDEVGPNDVVPGLVRGAEICVSLADSLREGAGK